MAAPTYSQQFSIGLLGTISNLLSQPMTFYRCTVCGAVIAEGQTGTAGRDLHTAWHTSLDTVASNASSANTASGQAAKDAAAAKTSASQAATAAQTAASESTAAKTAATGAASSASSASQAASTAASSASSASSAADRASTSAQVSASDAKLAEDAASASAAALAQITEQTGMCPLCRAEVATDKINVHLTYHYRRAHGDPVEFPADFDPTTQDMAEVDPPMRVANQG